MRIEEEVKLDYSDVLFRPKRSTLKSRKEVDLSRTYKFKHSNREWTGIPIIASNMDGVGELQVANSLSKFDIITALTKQHTLEMINSFISIKDIFNYEWKKIKIVTIVKYFLDKIFFFYYLIFFEGIFHRDNLFK